MKIKLNLCVAIFMPFVLFAAPLKVGIVIDQTGPGVPFTGPIKNGMHLALESLPKETADKLEIIFEDDGLSGAKAVSATEKLININKAQIIVNASSATGMAIAPIAERRKIPFIGIATDPSLETGRKYVVNLWPSSDKEGLLLCKEIEKRGYKSIAIVTTFHAAMNAMRASYLKCNKVEVVFDEEFVPETKDFRAVIAKLVQRSKQNKIDGIYLNLFFGQVGLFARQYRELGGTAEFFNMEATESEEEVKIAAGALENTWYAMADDVAGNSALMVSYKKRFPGAGTFGSLYGYMVIQLLADYVTKSDSYTSEGLNNYLHNIKDFPGVFGPLSIGADNRFDLPVMLKTVKNGEFVALG